MISRTDARSQGKKRFFTGLPCVHGHVAERLVSCNACVVCNAIHNAKPKTREQVKEYYRHNRTALKEKNSKRHFEQRADRLKKMKAYREENRDKIRKMRADYRKNNLDKVKRRSAKYRAANAKKIAEKKAMDYRANPDAFKARALRHYEQNKPLHRAYRHARRAREIGAGGKHSAADIDRIVKAQRGRCAYCKASFKAARMDVDHIVPLARGGSNDARNLQALCASCNRSKSAKDPVAYAQSRGFLL